MDHRSDDMDRPLYFGETIKPELGESYDWHAHDFGQLISAASGSMYVGTPDRVLLLNLLYETPDRREEARQFLRQRLGDVLARGNDWGFTQFWPPSFHCYYHPARKKGYSGV